MSEITVTLPKEEYDKLNEKICKLKKELLDLQDIVRKKQYFYKLIQQHITHQNQKRNLGGNYFKH